MRSGSSRDLRAVIVDEVHAIAQHQARRPARAGAGDVADVGAGGAAYRAVGDGARSGVRWRAGWGRTRRSSGIRAARRRISRVLDSEARIPWSGHTGRHNIREVYEAIKGAKMSLVFVNTRSQAEMTFQELWRVNEDGLPIALHHGSLDVEQRRKRRGGDGGGQAEGGGVHVDARSRDRLGRCRSGRADGRAEGIVAADPADRAIKPPDG